MARFGQRFEMDRGWLGVRKIVPNQSLTSAAWLFETKWVHFKNTANPIANGS